MLQRVACGVKSRRQRVAAAKRHQYADQGDEKRRLSGFFQLVNVRLQSRAEHQENDAQLRKHGKKVAGLH
ncbi:hypothetical protein SDC9_89278 [bioreactor metagenome]|uniref:Uncharacterized protein n=1 Tax=bioreactor metagenome TaxID=1076179 RepID=A0A644ZP45_9ZZZZ